MAEITAIAVVTTATTVAGVMETDLVNIAVAVADVALAMVADTSTTHTLGITTLAHLATALVDVSTAEVLASRLHINH